MVTLRRGRARPCASSLLTNDDGIHAEGLRAAAEAFGEFAELVVVAPDREQSACGHSLTLNRPVRLEEVRPGQFSVDGTPTDCVNLAVHWLLRDQPVDLVVSGINYGLNLGDDVTYSGTVSAALEAHLLGLPAIAFSQQIGEETSFARAAKVAATLVRGLLEHGHPAAAPCSTSTCRRRRPKGVRFTRLARRVYEQVVVERGDPRGRRYFWIGGEPRWEEGPDCDHAAVTAGMVSITPLRLDLTDYGALEEQSGVIAASSRAPGVGRLRDGYAYQRERMVRELERRGIADPRVLEALRSVPRHLFVRDQFLAKAYGNYTLPIGAAQTLSQPYIVARMTELLAIQPAHRVLEIGTGSGYQTAVLASLARWVYSMERIPELARAAIQRMRDLKLDNVKIQAFDGTVGWAKAAPFDRILVAAGAPAAPAPLLEQLAVDGLLLLPEGDRERQRLVRYHRRARKVEREEGEDVGFVPLIGRHGWAEKP